MRRAARVLLVSALLGTPVTAHHSFAMFDMDKDLTLVGTITEVKWQNPHTHFRIRVGKVRDVDPATIGEWDVEGAAIAIMGRQGWTKTTLKVGDQAAIVGHPLKSGEKGVSLFYLIRPDGSRLYQDIARPRDDPKKQP
jgi:hypothetical protein